MAYRLSIVIPARNEVCYDIDLLSETIKNLLENTTDACQIITILDGYWPNEPIPAHPRVTVIHHSQSIGQRAATNEGVRVATGEWVCKLDAHCAVGPEFDVRLLQGAQPHWTIVPGQYNLQVFQWKCKRCDWTKDQSPKPPKCEKCGSRYVKQVKVWQPRDGQGGRRRAYTHSWRFDSTLTFQYWGQYAADEAHCKKHNVPFRPETQQPIHDTMCLLGACWAIRRERYIELDMCDTAFGSWGQQGVEVALKTHLSGGELKVNQNTWFAHFFRVGGLNFPYPDGGRKERAVARSKELFLSNKWDKQVHPLSWLIDKFAPVPDWFDGNPIWESVKKAGRSFVSPITSLSLVSADATISDPAPVVPLTVSIKDVPFQAASLSRVDDGNGSGIPANVIPVVGNKSNVKRITTGGVIANNVIQDGDVATAPTQQGGNQPCVHIPVGQFDVPHVVVSDMSIPVLVTGADPDPASNLLVDFNAREDASQLTKTGPLNDQKTSTHGLTITNPGSVGYLYYTCNSHDELLELAARANLMRAKKGNEIGCVALKRTDFGDWSIVLDRPKSGTTMHYQILAGLERMRSEYVFLCESDVFYHVSHFDFRPPSPLVFYYNTNVWRVRWKDGHAVRTASLQQVSGICASRKLLLEHYRRRVQLVEQNNGQFDVKRMAYEPGTRGKFGDEKIANWESPFPNLDITGHGNTLTTPHFSVDSFRNKKYSIGWMETDDVIEGWPKIAGRLQEWLREIVDE